MSRGLCPLCKKVISSDSKNCPECGELLKINMIPKEKRVPYKQIGGPRIASTILAGIGGGSGAALLASGGGDLMPLLLVLFLGSFIAMFCIMPAINRRWLQLCMEDAYRRSDKKESQRSYVAKNEDNRAQKSEQRDVAELSKNLTELKNLLDSGAISAEEYDALKKELLSK